MSGDGILTTRSILCDRLTYAGPAWTVVEGDCGMDSIRSDFLSCVTAWKENSARIIRYPTTEDPSIAFTRTLVGDTCGGRRMRSDMIPNEHTGFLRWLRAQNEKLVTNRSMLAKEFKTHFDKLAMALRYWTFCITEKGYFFTPSGLAAP
jgi:hypothetical protein